DGFGTGVASTGFVKRFPIDVLKIGRTLIAGLGASGHQAVIVEGIVRMADGLGLQTVGEGVETEEQAEGLRAIGCEMAQGNHWAREGPALRACNHISVIDPVIIALAPSYRGRTVRFLAAAEMFEKPLVGPGLRLIRQIPIRRGERDVGALEEAAEVIAQGALAGIFPEGGV